MRDDDRETESDDSGEEETVNDEPREAGNVRDKKAARRVLYRKPPESSSGNTFITRADVHNDSDVTVKQMLAKMAADMNMHYNSLHERIDKFEAGLEQRISTKVAQLLDKRVNSEMNRIRKDVDERLDAFKESFQDEINGEFDVITGKLHSLQSLGHSYDRSLNVAVRGLPQSTDEI